MKERAPILACKQCGKTMPGQWMSSHCKTHILRGEKKKKEFHARMKSRLTIRLKDVAEGKREPKTRRDWAVFHEQQRKTNTDLVKNLHAHAAIHIPSKMAGKIVVVPPKPV